jgi:hypothetical protein
MRPWLIIPEVGPYLSLPIYPLAGYFTAYVAAKKQLEIHSFDGRAMGVRGAFDVLPGLTPAKVLDSTTNLAHSVKPAVLPGESIEVKIQREGREQDPGESATWTTAP